MADSTSSVDSQAMIPATVHLEADVNNRLDIPIATLRTTGLNDTQDPSETSLDPLDAILSAPLPGLRCPTENEDYLHFSRSPSPSRTESEDEDSDLEYIPGSGERVTTTDSTASSAAGNAHNESMETPLPPSTSSTADNAHNEPTDTPLPPSTSEHRMTNQTIRSFRTRAAKAKEVATEESEATPVPANGLATSTSVVVVPPPPAPPAKKKRSKAVSRSASSLSISDAAPDDAELFRLLDLVPPPNSKEGATEHRTRANHNDRRLVALILALQNTVEDNKKSQIEHQKEVLRRLADQQLSSPASSASLMLNTTADIARLKQVVAESREALSNLTVCVNNLVDIPVRLTELQRAVQSLLSQPKPAALPLVRAPGQPQESAPASITNVDHVRGRTTSESHGAKRTSGSKRSRAFSPTAVEQPEKRAKTSEGEVWYYDVYVFPVKPEFGTANEIAMEVIDATRTPVDAFVSAIHPHGIPKSVVSIRFNNSSVATSFIDRMRTNPPSDMHHIQAMTPTAYAKKREAETAGNNHKGHKANKSRKADKAW